MSEGLARQLAIDLHHDQVDKAGKPYIGHLERVVAYHLARWPEAPGYERAAAWLHDSIEDHRARIDTLLLHGLPAATVSLVAALTRPPKVTYLDWIRSMAAAGRTGVIRIKLADLADNADPCRLAAIENGASLAARYRAAQALLERALGAFP